MRYVWTDSAVLLRCGELSRHWIPRSRAMQDFPFRLQHPSGEPMWLERDMVLVGFRDDAPDADAVLRDLGLMAEQELEPVVRQGRDLQFGGQPLNRTDTRVWARTIDGTAFRASVFRDPSGIVEWVSPVYRVEAGGSRDYLTVLTHVLLIAFAQSDYVDALHQYALREAAEFSEDLGEYGYFRRQRPLEETSIELRPWLLREGNDLLRDARCDIMPMFVPLAFMPNDTYFGKQWN